MSAPDVEPAPVAALADEVTKAIGSGEFESAFVVEADVVGRLVMAWAKARVGPAADGCRVMCPAPCVVLIRPKAGPS